MWARCSAPCRYSPRRTRRKHARKTAALVGLSGRNLNAGLRTIYFAIAGLAWFVNPILFALACAFVTFIVYRREYRSEAFTVLDR
jgi:uncharacterized membrane protein